MLLGEMNDGCTCERDFSAAAECSSEDAFMVKKARFHKLNTNLPEYLTLELRRHLLDCHKQLSPVLFIMVAATN